MTYYVAGNYNGDVSEVADDYTLAGLVTEDADGENATGAVGSMEAVYATVDVADIGGVISVGNGLTMYIDNLTISNFETPQGSEYRYALSVGTHTVSIVAEANYSADNATITFNGSTVQNGGTIEVTADMIRTASFSAPTALSHSPRPSPSRAAAETAATPEWDSPTTYSSSWSSSS